MTPTPVTKKQHYNIGPEDKSLLETSDNKKQQDSSKSHSVQTLHHQPGQEKVATNDRSATNER